MDVVALILIVLASMGSGFIGFGLGFSFCEKIDRKAAVGDLRLETSDPDGPYLFLELDRPIDDWYQRRVVLLRVKLKNYIPQK